MSETLDLLIRHARLRRRPGALYDIAVQGGCIELIEESPGVSAAVVVDAAGGLVTEPFVNPHLHLDKVADVDSKARLEGVKVKEEFRGVVELQVVAFPQDGVLWATPCMRLRPLQRLDEESFALRAYKEEFRSPARRISCGRRWRWARTWSEASPGSSTRMPRLEVRRWDRRARRGTPMHAIEAGWRRRRG